MNKQVSDLKVLAEEVLAEAASNESLFRSSVQSTNTIAVIRRRRRTYWAGCDGV
ncbi:MAG: hypothetical protein OQK51_13970 [Kangiellaceae bacterium]|nr:hypothetical protein [Kangiellaceae bacterium]